MVAFTSESFLLFQPYSFGVSAKFCGRQWKSYMSFCSWLWHLLIQYLNIFPSFVTRFTSNLLKARCNPVLQGCFKGEINPCFAHRDCGGEIPSLPTPVLSPQSSACQCFCQPSDYLIHLLWLCDKLYLFLLLTFCWVVTIWFMEMC